MRSSPGIDGLDAAAEEVGHVRVLLGLGDPQLREAEVREILAEAVGDGLRRERDRQAGELVAVAREADEAREPRHAAAREAVERRVGERARDLPGAVGAEVHEHDDVAVRHRRRRGPPRRRSPSACTNSSVSPRA